MPNIIRKATERLHDWSSVRFRRRRGTTQVESAATSQDHAVTRLPNEGITETVNQEQDLTSSGVTTLDTSILQQTTPSLVTYLADANGQWDPERAQSKSKLSIALQTSSNPNASSEVDVRQHLSSSSPSGRQRSSFTQMRHSGASSPTEHSSRQGRQSPVLSSPIVARDMQNPSRPASFITQTERSQATSVLLPTNQDMPDLVPTSAAFAAVEVPEVPEMDLDDFDPGPSCPIPDHESSTTESSYEGPSRSRSDLISEHMMRNKTTKSSHSTSTSKRFQRIRS